VLLNDLLPVWAVLALLVALLAFSCKSILLRGLNDWAEEQQKVAAAHAAAAIRSGPVPRLAPISIAHSPSALLPARLQVVISREASRAQIADSSDDEEGGGGSRRGGRSAGGGGLAGAAASPPPLEQGQQQQEQQEQQQRGVGEGGSIIARAGSLKSALTTVPSGDSEQLDEGIGPALGHPSGGGRGSSGSGSSGGGGGGVLGEEDGSAGDAFSRALEQEERQWLAEGAAGSRASGGVLATAGAAAAGGGSGGAPAKQVEWRDLTEAAASAAAPSSPPPPQQQQQQQQQLAHAALNGRPPGSGGGGGAFGVPGSPLWAASSPQLALRFPWIKLVSLALLWLGFLGLSALDALLPLCSVTYVAYLLLFMAITLGVTAMVGRWGGGANGGVGFAGARRRAPWGCRQRCGAGIRSRHSPRAQRPGSQKRPPTGLPVAAWRCACAALSTPLASPSLPLPSSSEPYSWSPHVRRRRPAAAALASASPGWSCTLRRATAAAAAVPQARAAAPAAAAARHAGCSRRCWTAATAAAVAGLRRHVSHHGWLGQVRTALSRPCHRCLATRVGLPIPPINLNAFTACSAPHTARVLPRRTRPAPLRPTRLPRPPPPAECDDSSSSPPASLSVVAALSAAVAGAAGLLAGTAGLGGGSMLGSALLDFRVHPQVGAFLRSLCPCRRVWQCS
jgi:hypothetical protein